MNVFLHNLAHKKTIQAQQVIVSAQLQSALERQLKASQRIIDTVRTTLVENDRIRVRTKENSK